MHEKRKMRSLIVVGVVWTLVGGAGCASLTIPDVGSLPRACIVEGDWFDQMLVDEARRYSVEVAAMQLDNFVDDDHKQVMEYLKRLEKARLMREDYLEAYCYSINAYRKSFGR